MKYKINFMIKYMLPLTAGIHLDPLHWFDGIHLNSPAGVHLILIKRVINHIHMYIDVLTVILY